MNIKNIIITSIILITACTTNIHGQESNKIDAVLAKKIVYNKNNPEGKGFKIQLFYGDETMAYRIKNNYQVEFNETAEIKYEEPWFAIRVGNFLTRLEADRALIEIKKKFTGAIVLKTDIKL